MQVVITGTEIHHGKQTLEHSEHHPGSANSPNQEKTTTTSDIGNEKLEQRHLENMTAKEGRPSTGKHDENEPPSRTIASEEIKLEEKTISVCKQVNLRT